MSSSKPAVVAVLIAIGITTAMDATGYSMLSALPLFPLTVALWVWQRFSRAEMGLVLGSARDHLLALLYPATVLGAATAVAWLAGAVDTTAADWDKAGLNIALSSTIGVLMALITEEGFFRGWLWASLERSGQSPTRVLIWTSLAFTLWHVSAVSLETGFDLPLAQIPIYLLNATLIGAVWGVLRMISGSVLVPSVSHAVWNAFAYALFGFGTRSGALGISRTDLYGPEVGFVGLALNAAFAAALWIVTKRRRAAVSSG